MPAAANIHSPSAPRSRTAAQVALIVLAAVVIYWAVLRGGWLWDDDAEIRQNIEVTGSGGLAKIWLEPSHADYFPLKSTVQWLGWRAWGDSVAGWHALNIVLHVVGALLLWRLLARLGLRAAWLGGLLFVIHPLAVESVAWIAELKNTLSLPPLLLAAMAYVDFERSGSRARYIAALAWFLASLLCKTSGVMLPIVLLLFHGWKAGRITARNVRALAPFFAVSLVLGLLTIHFQHTRAIIGAPVPIGGPAERVAIAGLAAAFYVGKFFAPVGLLPVYPQWKIAPGVLDFWPWLVGGALVVYAWRRRAGWGRTVLFGLGAFLALVAPVLGFVGMSYMRYSWVADHFVYLPMIALVALVVAAIDAALARAEGGRRPVVFGVVAVACVALIALSARHAAVFRDATSLWTYTLRHNPRLWAAHNNLGSTLQGAGRHAEAIAHFEIAMAGDPQFASPRNNLGVSLAALGRTEEAIAQFRAALQIDPSYAAARTNLANTLAQQGRLDEALAEYRAALTAQPRLVEARFNFASALHLAGRPADALAELKRVIADRPGYAEAHNNAGKILVRERRAADALPFYEEAVRLAPHNAAFRSDLGFALLQLGRNADAELRFAEAVRLNPASVDARVNLGGLRYQAGDLAGAAAHFEAALEIDPQSAEARQNLAIIRAQLERATPRK